MEAIPSLESPSLGVNNAGAYSARDIRLPLPFLKKKRGGGKSFLILNCRHEGRNGGFGSFFSLCVCEDEKARGAKTSPH